MQATGPGAAMAAGTARRPGPAGPLPGGLSRGPGGWVYGLWLEGPDLRSWSDGGASVYELGDGPAGDVVTAILQVDSRLRVIHRKIDAWAGERPPGDTSPGETALTRTGPGDLPPGPAAAGEQAVGQPPAMPVVAAAEDATDLRDGYCTVVYVIVRWACAAREADGGTAADALAEMVRMLFSRLILLKRVVPRPAIPTMIALVTAAAMESSPQRWHDRCSQAWAEGDAAALEAMAVCLAEWVNTAQRSPDAALRLIMDAYERAVGQG
jgi:hypothetical protein